MNNLNILANDIDKLVNGFLSKAQLSPMQNQEQVDAGNDLPRSAIVALINKNSQNSIKAWNDMLQKVSDAAYDALTKSRSLDVAIKAQLVGKGYKVRLSPMIDPPNSEGQRALGRYFDGLSHQATAAATKAIQNATKNTSFGAKIEHLKF